MNPKNRVSFLTDLVLGIAVCVTTVIGYSSRPAEASGVLSPTNTKTEFEIRSHRVRLVIDNGFAMTEVVQTFFNPSSQDEEGLYRCPLPKEAALSEFSILSGETEIAGEVVEVERARQLYNQERKAGREAGLAEKDDFRAFEFRIGRIKAGEETRIRHVYYQPLRIDTGTGRYLYPLEDGGTEGPAERFWTAATTEVSGDFSFEADIKSAFPIDAVRLPNHGGARVTEIDSGHWNIILQDPDGGSLSEDIVLYYRLADGLPGRLEVIPFRDEVDGEGTFMAVLTPGISLGEITEGTDWTFLLDISGSMQSKLAALSDGIIAAVDELDPRDRFRIVLFNNRAREFQGYKQATEQNVQTANQQMKKIQTGGGTNVFEGLDLAIKGLDAERTSALVLVTDGVANEGPTSQKEFGKLLKEKDVRIFTAVMGNSANWPLMEFVSAVSHGFCIEVSNADDILGRLILAREKVTHEAMHDLKLEFDGVVVDDLTPTRLPSLYNGQQLVVFGHYDKAGRGELRVCPKSGFMV